MSQLNLFLLGTPRVELAGVPVDLNRRKVLALLLYLTVTRQRHRRDTLATLFWPESDQRTARAALRREFHTLTTTLGNGWFAADRESIALATGTELWVDVEAFRHHHAAWRAHAHSTDALCNACLAHLTTAVALYQSDFLTGFTLSDCPDFDDWQFFQAESLRRELADSLETLLHWYCAQGEYEPAINYARRWLALDPLHEPAHRELMQLYALAGQTAAAVRQYQECLRLLDQELGVEPEAATTALFEAIRTRRFPAPDEMSRERLSSNPPVTIPVASTVEPASAHLPAPAPPHNLPPQATPFVGRAQEVADIVQRLCDPACRLLTLVGPGGMGKTRLAIEAARALIAQGKHHFAAGIRFVPLAGVSSTNEIVSALAAAVDLQFSGSAAPQQQLIDNLREKQLLFVLDNFEQLLVPAEKEANGALLSMLLTAAPQLKLLVTSREALNLQEEWFHQIGGLGFPSEGDAPDRQIADYDAVQLFAQCARRARRDFSLADEVTPVVQICRLVAGMPLALELAAAWLKVLTPQGIAAEIAQNLDILTAQQQNVPERHRSLRVIFEQTWQRLAPEEQLVLRKLAIFQGGCTRDAAARVTGGTIAVLGTLVDKALVRRANEHVTAAKDESRFYFHPLLQQYAAEKLQAEPTMCAQTAAAHAQYYLNLVEQQSKQLKSAKRKRALAIFEAEFANIRAAWHSAIAGADLDALAHFALPLSTFFERRAQEGLKLFQQAAAALTESDPAHESALGAVLVAQAEQLMRLGDDPAHSILLAEQALVLLRHKATSPVTIKANNLLGNAFWLQGDYPKAKMMLEEGLAFLRVHGPATEIGDLLIRLGLVERELHSADRVMAFYQTSLEELRTLGDPVSLAHQLLIYGEYLVVHDQLHEGAHFLAESLALARAAGGTDFFPFILMHLGITACKLGDYTGAEKYLREVLTIAQAEARAHPEALAHLFLGRVKVAQQALTAAEAHLVQGLQLGWSHKLTLVATLALVCFAELYTAQGELSQAVVLLTAALAHPATEQRDKQAAAQQLAQLQEKVAAATFAAATARGNAASLEELITQLLRRTHVQFARPA
jgi:DNA-binding SARP family transcriptional activator/predicted ATPase